MSFLGKPLLHATRNDSLQVKYLNVNESTLLFNSSHSNDLNTLKSFDTPSEFNRSISSANDNDGHQENIYFQISKFSHSNLNNSVGSTKYYERLHMSKNTDNNELSNADSLNKLNSSDCLQNHEHESIFNFSSRSFSNNSTKRKMPLKINLLSSQQTRMRKIEKLMAKNLILTPIAIIFSIIIAIILFISIFTDYYEYTYYDINQLNRIILNENNNTLNKIEKNFFIRNETLFQNSKRMNYNESDEVYITASDIIELVDVFFQFAKDLNNESTDKLQNFQIFNNTYDNLASILYDNVTYTFYKLASNNLTTDGSTLFNEFNTDEKLFYDPNINNNIYFNNVPNEFYVLSHIKISFFNNIVVKNYFIHTTYSGLWQTCNFLSGK